ncbi:MAG: thermonuclease family protein [Candidatus Omnitrophica bacterium]|nr:thermonuclease family protein [Candidatus Omnitrophota bacterium]
MNPIPEKTYKQALKSIRAEIAGGRNALEDTYRRQVIVTNWNIGRIIEEQLLPTDQPSAGNAQAVYQLSRDLGRTDTFIYQLAKFYRYYPTLPDTTLSWSHYASLTHIDDPSTRDKLEQKAIKQGLSSKRFREVIALRRQAAKKKIKQAQLAQTVERPGMIPCLRGELYYYRCLFRAYIPTNETQGLIDLGFGLLRKTTVPKWKDRSRLLYVHIYKDKQCYDVRIANTDAWKLYTYVATVQRVVDGDTVMLNIDMGFDSWIQEKVRLRAIDTPEIDNPLGRLAKHYVEDQLKKVKFVVCKTHKEDKFGRFLADIFYLPGESDPRVVAREGNFLNQVLVDQGHAQVWKK